jgi:hypothetical protein
MKMVAECPKKCATGQEQLRSRRNGQASVLAEEKHGGSGTMQPNNWSLANIYRLRAGRSQSNGCKQKFFQQTEPNLLDTVFDL